MKVSATIVLIYGFLVLVGGILGHLKTGSQASLISGILFGLVILGAAALIYKNKIAGQYIALVSSLLLDAFFTYRLALTHKLMPAGLMSLLSLAVTLSLIFAMRKNKSDNLTSPKSG